ncbi:MAG: pilus assembly FimT family protein [Planctomycetota bacterium]|jgi:prepilin-type N-terminal cleavage/methylation domain-containing protein
MSAIAASRSARRFARSFTLTELLVVIAVIAVLATLTVVSVRAVTKDARLSSSTNTVTASLDNARSLAMKTNKPVLVAFYPRAEGNRDARVDVITAQWTGDSIVATVRFPNEPVPAGQVFDRFRPAPDVPVRSLPRGAKIAGPSYADETDTAWLVTTELTRPREALGQIVGVMYGPDGTTLAENPANDSDFFFIDFNGSGHLEMDMNSDGQVDLAERVLDPSNQPVDLFDFLYLGHPADEVAINLVPFVAVYDDEAARDRFGDEDWIEGATRDAELTEFINQNANRIHFNRYTGVVMR